LACRDFGGEGPSVLLLHGLAGHVEEWASTAAWLTTRCRVVGLDARGHGRGERSPDDVSRAAQVADAAFAVERLRLQPAVVVEASPEGGLEDGERTGRETFHEVAPPERLVYSWRWVGAGRAAWPSSPQP
jgi:alpha-beta hydrolase superfamily lysophospholipase